MSKFSSSLIGLGLGLLMASGLWAQRYAAEDGREHTYPPSAGGAYTEGGGTFTMPTNSGMPEPLVITPQNAPWNGQGSVGISFRANQRARVMLAVYRKGSNATGVAGRNGSVVRVTAQDEYVNHTPLAPYEAGNNTITWDGNDWEGNAAGPGNYEFDLIGFNDLDANKTIRVGASGGAWGPNTVVTSVEPAEIWSPFQETPPIPYARSIIGTDYVANPTAVEVWSVTAFSEEEERNMTGNVPDDVAPQTTHWTSRQRPNEALELQGGIIKLTRNDAAKTMDVDESFGDNGISVSRGSRTYHIRPHQNIVYGCFNNEDLQAAFVEKYDKSSGERIQDLDVFEYFHHISLDEDGNEFTRILGPNVMDVNDNGIWITSHNTNNTVHLDHDGNVIWINRLGDGIKDWVSNENAAELGIQANQAVTVGYGADDTGKISYATDTHNGLGYQLAMMGRDGAGLANVEFDPATGPWNRGNNTKHIDVVNEGGRYDGLYISGGRGDGAFPTAYPEMAMGVFLPYDLATGTLGAGVTAVEENGPASTPDSYALSDAYPNPFNPETTIEFSVPSEGRVKIEVYNTAGQLLTSLVDEELKAGAYKTTWDARDESGGLMASGTYFYRMHAGDFSDTRAMTLLK